MKNIHVLSTDKQIKNVGDLVKDQYGDIHIFTKNDGKEYGKTTTKLNIYITSDEKFIRDEYVTDGIEVIKATSKLVDAQGLVDRRDWKKIILTTDELYIHNDLIPKEYNLFPQYIQKIDDEFLEWFVNNPSCEWVGVEKAPYDGTKSIDKYWGGEYKIIIPRTTQQVIDEDFAGGLDIGQILPKQDMNTCKNFDRETGCELVDCPCEKEEILEAAKQMMVTQEHILEQIALTEARGEKIVKYLNRYKGDLIYNEIALAIEFGYQLKLEEDEK